MDIIEKKNRNREERKVVTYFVAEGSQWHYVQINRKRNE